MKITRAILSLRSALPQSALALATSVAALPMSAAAQNPQIGTAVPFHAWSPQAPAGHWNAHSYGYDDGTSENAVHVTNGAGGSTCWMHMFDAAGGSDTITTVSTAWGSPTAGSSANPSNGTPANVCVWEDPNDDGNPIDAVLLANVPTYVSAAGTDTIVPVAVPATIVSGRFFVGAYLSPHAQGIFPAPMDTGSASLGRAWVCGNGGTVLFDPSNLAGAGLPPIEMDAAGFPAVFLLRAEGSGNPTTVYCTAKVNSLGCTPTIGSTGIPDPNLTHGFKISCVNVRNNKGGLLFYGNSGQYGAPFQGGTLCVRPPIRRTPVVFSGGSPLPSNDCSGMFSIDMNAFTAGALGGAPAAFLYVLGTTVDTQWWGRDPGFPAPNNTSLSEGLEYTVTACPSAPSFSDLVWNAQVVHWNNGGSFDHTATLTGIIAISPQGQPNGFVDIVFDDASSARVSMSPSGACTIQSGSTTLDILSNSPWPPGDLCLINGQSSSLSGLATALRSSVLSGASPNSLPAAQRALLAMSSLGKTAVWSNFTQLVKTYENCFFGIMNWVCTANIVITMGAFVTLEAFFCATMCAAGGSITLGTFVIPCGVICAGGALILAKDLLTWLVAHWYI